MKYSIEQLYHFNCSVCDKWWSVSDAQLNETGIWYCPWCGFKQVLDERPVSEAPVEVITKEEILEAIEKEEAKGIVYKTNDLTSRTVEHNFGDDKTWYGSQALLGSIKWPPKE